MICIVIKFEYFLEYPPLTVLFISSSLIFK